ncbi:MAG: DUF6132 family protein [Bacteroidia bacterium]|nr:DUF6132 family protein [Bacteroidia bacterium]
MNTLAIARKMLPVVIGTGAGYAYWYFIGCLNGSCPITGTWYTSTLYGALVGATWLLPGKKKTKNTTTEHIPSDQQPEQR